MTGIKSSLAKSCRTGESNRTKRNTTTLIRLTNSSEGYDVSDRLGEVECPTLIVNATDDVLIPLVEQTRLHEGIKNSEMVIIPKCGHASMYEKPMLFSSLVLGWINVKDEDYESIFA